jgi:flagellar hook-basal body complex protein FliE
MKKWILIGAGAVIVLIIVVVVMLATNLGPIIKKAVNSYGPDITKTKVSLGDVDISLFSGKATLKNFFLGNPKGFKAPYAMKVGSIKLDIDEKSIPKDTIIIDRIEVVSPDITYEKIKGGDNFQTILQNVTSSVGGEKQAAEKPSQKKEPGKKVLIRDFLIKGGKVNLAMSLLGGKTITAALPEIHLKNIGEKTGGASPAEAFKEVFQSLYAKITSPAVTDVLNKGLQSLGTNLNSLGSDASKQVKSAQDAAKKTAEGIKGKLKGLLGE